MIITTGKLAQWQLVWLPIAIVHGGQHKIWKFYPINNVKTSS